MKKMALILGLFYSLTMAENIASDPVNKTATNNSQPKLIMVKGTSSNQNSHTTSTGHGTQKHTSHAKKTKSHGHRTNHTASKKTKHTKTSTKKVAHKSKTSKNTNN